MCVYVLVNKYKLPKVAREVQGESQNQPLLQCISQNHLTRRKQEMDMKPLGEQKLKPDD